MSSIVRFYVNRIQHDKMTLDDVPNAWRADVEKVLENT